MKQVTERDEKDRMGGALTCLRVLWFQCIMQQNFSFLCCSFFFLFVAMGTVSVVF